MIGPTSLLFFLYALRDAAREGNLVKVRDLVNDGATPSANHLVDRYSPLHAAARQGHLPVVQYLVRDVAAAQVHATEKYEESTPLHEACKGGHLAVVKFLVEQGQADVHYQDKTYRNALHKAAASGHVSVARYLVAYTAGALVQEHDADFKTPLHDACIAGHLAVVQFLVQQARARIHAPSVTGDTPLHYAVMHGHVDVATFLWREAQARLDLRNQEGQTPVDCARVVISMTMEPKMSQLVQQWTQQPGSSSSSSSKEPALPSPTQTMDTTPPTSGTDALTARDYKPEQLMMSSSVNQPSGSINAFDNLQQPTSPAMNPNRLKQVGNNDGLPRHDFDQVSTDDKINGMRLEMPPSFSTTSNSNIPPPPLSSSSSSPGTAVTVPERQPAAPPPPEVGGSQGPSWAPPPPRFVQPATFSKIAPPPTTNPAVSEPVSHVPLPPQMPEPALPAQPAVQGASSQKPPILKTLETAVPAQPVGAVLQTSVAPVQSRLGRLEQEIFMAIQQGDTTLERLAKLEGVLLGQAQTGTISTRLSVLEQQRVDIDRIGALETELGINSLQQGSLMERLEMLEFELSGSNAAGPLSARLQKLEEEATDMERIVRLEQELAINPGQQGSRLDRLGSLEQELFGETYAGTTFSSRLGRLESELLS